MIRWYIRTCLRSEQNLDSPDRLQCAGDCHKAVQTRQVMCADIDGQVIASELCSSYRKPAMARSCELECDGISPRWFASQWSEVGVKLAPCLGGKLVN